MSYGAAFHAFLGRPVNTTSPRLSDWLMSLDHQTFLALRVQMDRCISGKGTQEENDDLAIVAWLHHSREHRTDLDDYPYVENAWARAFENVQNLILFVQEQRH